MRTTLAFILTILWAAAASAQVSESKTSVGATIGFGQTWGDESSLGNGWSAGTRADRVLFGTTRGEVAIDLLAHQRTDGFFKADGHTTLVSAGVEQRFGRARVQPYVRGGVLLARHSGDYDFAGDRRSRTSSDAGFYFGGGMAVRVGERLEIGPDVRAIVIAIDNDNDPTLAYTVGLRAAWRVSRP